MNGAKEKVPARADRGRITPIELLHVSQPDKVVKRWLVGRHSLHKVACSNCGLASLRKDVEHRAMPFRSLEKECGGEFSVRAGTILVSFRMSNQTWVFVISIVMASLNWASLMNLHRHLGFDQWAAPFLLQRLGKAMTDEGFLLAGLVEADDTHVGSLEVDKHKNAAEGPGDVSIVACVWDRETGRIAAKSVPENKFARLVSDLAAPGAQVSTYEARGHLRLHRRVYDHRPASHFVVQWDDEMAHPNGMKPSLSMAKPDYRGTYLQMSCNHLGRYVAEFSRRHNRLPKGTVEQLGCLVRGIDNKGITCEQSIAQGLHIKRRMELPA